MKAEEARHLIALSDDPEEPVAVPASVLSELTIHDLPEGAALQIGVTREGVVHLDWVGKLYREGDVIFGEADHTWTRKYWYSPLGLEQYLDLVRRAVETRHRLRGDVELSYYDDDGAYVLLRFRINTVEQNLARAYASVRRIAAEVEEAAEQAADEVGQRIAEVAARLSGWGSESRQPCRRCRDRQVCRRQRQDPRGALQPTIFLGVGIQCDRSRSYRDRGN
jgi:hypothetical protein